MPITKTTQTLVAWAEINDHCGVDLSVRAELRDIIACRSLTPAEALQLADELRDVAETALAYAQGEATA